MSQLFVQDKDVVVPGESLAEGMDYLPGPGSYRKGDTIVANRVGLVSVAGRAIKLIPLSGPYMPKRDDVIICKVTDITLNGWRLDTNTPSSAMLSVRDATNTFIVKGSDLTKILQIGDYLVGGVVQVTTQKLIDVTLRGPGLRKLASGQLLKFSPNKFPRIIGRQGSMVSMIKRATNCQIVVGQNGLIWMSGEPAMEVIAVEAIRFIEDNAHTSGVTDRVKKLLESKGLTVPEGEAQDDQPRIERFGADREERGESREGGFGGGERRSFDGPREPRRDFGNRDGGDRRGGFGGNREGGFNRDGGNRDGGERRFERRDSGNGERRFDGERSGGFQGNNSGNSNGGSRFDRPRFERRDNNGSSNGAPNNNNNGSNDNNNAPSDNNASNGSSSDDSQQ